MLHDVVAESCPVRGEVREDHGVEYFEEHLQDARPVAEVDDRSEHVGLQELFVAREEALGGREFGGRLVQGGVPPVAASDEVLELDGCGLAEGGCVGLGQGGEWFAQDFEEHFGLALQHLHLFEQLGGGGDLFVVSFECLV